MVINMLLLVQNKLHIKFKLGKMDSQCTSLLITIRTSWTTKTGRIWTKKTVKRIKKFWTTIWFKTKMISKSKSKASLMKCHQNKKMVSPRIKTNSNHPFSKKNKWNYRCKCNKIKAWWMSSCPFNLPVKFHLSPMTFPQSKSLNCFKMLRTTLK